MPLTADDRADLARARALLEKPGLAAQLSGYLGAPIEYGLRKLPAAVSRRLGTALEAALTRVATTAVATMEATGAPAKGGHALAAAAAGGVAGFFGPLTMLVEVPITTGVIFRSIAAIARAEGENPADPETVLACLEVFALGGTGRADDAADAGYYAVRAALAQQVKTSADFLARGGAGPAAPMLVAWIRRVAERLGVQYTEKLAAQAVPVVGAVGGAAINTIFIRHFQAMAEGHFVVRRLERAHGREAVAAAWDELGDAREKT